MKLTRCAELACYHLWARKKYTMRLFLNILLLFAVLVVWIVLSLAMENAQDDYIYGTAAQNQQVLSLSLDEAGEVAKDSSYDVLEQAKNWVEFETPVLKGTPDLPTVLQKDEWIFVNIKYVTLFMDGISYQGSNDNAPVQNNGSGLQTAAKFSFSTVYSDTVFTKNECTEFEYHNSNQPYLLCGSMDLRGQKLLISDAMLALFGLTGPPEQYLGRELKFIVDGQSLLEGYSIGGVLDSRICGDKSQIFIQGNAAINRQYGLSSIKVTMPIRSYSDTVDALKKLEGAGVFISFTAWETATYYNNIESIHLIIQRLVSLFGFLIMLAVVLNLSNVLIGAAENRSKQYGMLRAIGMPPVSLLIIAFTELFIISLTAMFCALLLSAAMLRGMDQLLMVFLNVPMHINLQQYATAGMTALLVLFGGLVIIELAILRSKCKLLPAALLRS